MKMTRIKRTPIGNTIPVMYVTLMAASLALVMTSAADARTIDYRAFDTSPVWPLCGRISENPPFGWVATDGCPVTRWGNPDHADYPLRYGFGPRVLVTQNRYDFHPGLDIPTPTGTPVFAMADGIVRTVRTSDLKVDIQHYRPGSWGGDCGPHGCYHTLYLHLDSAVVAENQVVKKGQLIGYSGDSSSGFQHLHFEIRDADASDATSNWMHNSIHPLHILPYHQDPTATQVTIANVDTSDPMNPQIVVEIVQAGSADPQADKRRFDINQVEIQVFDNRTRTVVSQPGLVHADGYHLHPPQLDLERHSHEYVHKDGGAQPWSSFAECPFASQHGPSYSADSHVGEQDPGDPWTGLFNGLAVRPEPILGDTYDYKLTLTFKEIMGLIDAADMCLVVQVKDVRGAYSASPATWNCTF